MTGITEGFRSACAHPSSHVVGFGAAASRDLIDRDSPRCANPGPSTLSASRPASHHVKHIDARKGLGERTEPSEDVWESSCARHVVSAGRLLIRKPPPASKATTPSSDFLRPRLPMSSSPWKLRQDFSRRRRCLARRLLADQRISRILILTGGAKTARAHAEDSSHFPRRS